MIIISFFLSNKKNFLLFALEKKIYSYILSLRNFFILYTLYYYVIIWKQREKVCVLFRRSERPR